MTESSREIRLRLCQKITVLPGCLLKELLDLIRRLQPSALRYVDSQWVFDVAELSDDVVRSVVDLVNQHIEGNSVSKLGRQTSEESVINTESLDSIAYVASLETAALLTESKKKKHRQSNNQKDANTTVINGIEVLETPNGKLVCAICQKEFRVRSEVVVHIRTHTGEKPLKCETCGKAFAHPSNLKAHERSHRGEKPYKCTFNGCEKSFAHPMSLKEHMAKHSCKKPFKCPICSKPLSSRAYLKKHIRAHDPEHG